MSRRLYDAVWNIPTLDSTEKLILLCLADHAKDDGYAFPSQEVLSARCSCHTKTIGRVTAKLEKLKWLSRWMDGSRHYQYQLNCEKIAQFNQSIPDSKSSHTGPEVLSQPDSKSIHTGLKVQSNQTQSPVIPDSKSPQSVINLSNNQSSNLWDPAKVFSDEDACAEFLMGAMVGLTEIEARLFFNWHASKKWPGIQDTEQLRQVARTWSLRGQKDQIEAEKKRAADEKAVEAEMRTQLGVNYGVATDGGLGGEWR